MKKLLIFIGGCVLSTTCIAMESPSVLENEKSVVLEYRIPRTIGYIVNKIKNANSANSSSGVYGLSSHANVMPATAPYESAPVYQKKEDGKVVQLGKLCNMTAEIIELIIKYKGIFFYSKGGFILLGTTNEKDVVLIK